MKSRTWNRPLPKRTLLGGEVRFHSAFPHANPGWILHHTEDKPQRLVVEPLLGNPETQFQLFPRFSESSQTLTEDPGFDPTPYLESYSWDWIEFRYKPLKDLDVRSIYWVPDPNMICGEYWVSNQTDHLRDIWLDMICALYLQRPGNQIMRNEIDGRPMLTGTLNDKKITLFVTGNPTFREDPLPILHNKLSIEPEQVIRIRWVCIFSDTRKAAREALTNVLELDWTGEISYRKVKLERQLEIRTGNPEWDFILAHSQNLGLLKYHQLTSHNYTARLSPIQALSLLQALTFPSADMIKDILDLVFNLSGQPDQDESIPDSDQTPPLMAGELLWQVYQMGFADEIWLPYLNKTDLWLKGWFSPGLDKDRDGVPELTHPFIFDLAGSSTAEQVISISHILPYPYLESPALGALIYNDLCRIEDLHQIYKTKTTRHHHKRKEILLTFLQDSWNSERAQFINRDSHSHISVNGYKIIENLQPGLNLLRESFPQPTRIGVLQRTSSDGSPPEDFRITYHGLDWQGNYRIEDHKSGDFSFGKGFVWGISECVYSKLDYCVLRNPLQTGQINLIAPTTSIEDITQNLPIWAGALPEEKARTIFKDILLDPDRSWSRIGFSSRQESGQETMHLFWNLLLGQSLHKLGMVEVVEELIERWMKAVIPILEGSGSSYPAYGINDGKGLGQEDCLESLFPIKFFLHILGIEMVQGCRLVIEGIYPFPWPVALKFRGIEIRREREQTSIKRPGQEKIILAEGEKYHIDLY